MLRLERARKGPSITVRLREKEPLFSSSLVTALLLSFIIHLSWLCIFRISSSPDDRLFPTHLSVNVEVENYPKRDPMLQTAFTPIEGFRSVLPRYIIEPEPSSPQLSPIETTCVTKKVQLLIAPSKGNSLFSKQRELPYIPEDNPLYFEEIDPAISVTVNGLLLERELLYDGCGAIRLIQVPRRLSQQIALRYNVRVNHHNGRVCWWEREGAATSSSLETMGRQIVKELRFSSLRKPGVPDSLTEGVIILLFQMGDQNDETHPWHQAVGAMKKQRGS